MAAHHQVEAEPGPQGRDPVCGMTVSLESKHRLEHGDTTFVFCCAGCLEKFRADPAQFAEDAPKPPPQEGLHTCPMHPEVQHDGPGSCPKMMVASARWNANGAPGNPSTTK